MNQSDKLVQANVSLLSESERALLPSVYTHKEFVFVLGASSTEIQT